MHFPFADDRFQDGEDFLPIFLPCRPALPLRILLLAEPFCIRRTAPCDITEPGIDSLIPQLIRGGIGFEVLHLRPDAKLWRVKGQPCFSPLRHPKAAEIVLRKSDRRAFPDDVRIYDMPHRHKAENNDLLIDAVCLPAVQNTFLCLLVSI